MTGGIALLALLLQLSAAKGSIEGTVIRAGTNGPASGVRVTLTRPLESRPPVAAAQTRPPASVPAAVTDAQGKFTLKDVEPGSYRLSISGNGYVRQEYGQKIFSGPGTPVDVAGGQALKGLVIPVTPTGNVGGRVLDTGNRPVAAIPVHVMRFTYDANGRKTLVPATSTQTDDRGEYRLYSLTPGRYVLAAGMLREGAAPRPFNGITESFAVTYYPGSADVTQAMAIDVTPGSDLNLNVAMAKQPLYRIRGRIVDSRLGQPPSSVILSLTPHGPAGGALYEISRGLSYNAVDGAFEVRDVMPGSYFLTASWGDSIALSNSQMSTLVGQPLSALARNSSAPFVTIRDGVAYASVSVVNSDIENLVLAILPGGSVSGRIRIDGQAAPNVGNAVRVYLRPSVDGPGGFQTRPVTIGAEGTFSIPNVRAGEYRVLAEELPQGYYVKEARIGPDDALNRPLQLFAAGAENNPLEIVLAPGATSVSGTVSSERLEPMGGAQVVLVPERLRDRMDLYKTVTSNARGQYTISNVAPGEYRLFAWEALEPNALFNPELLKQMESRGRIVRVQESSAQTVDVRATPMDAP